MNDKCLNVNGIMNDGGDITFEELMVNGILKVGGNIEVFGLKGDGIIKVGGNVLCKDIDFTGVFKVDNDVETEVMNFTGVFKANNIKGDNLNIEGKIDVKDCLNCDILDLTIVKKSTISHIEASKIYIKVDSLKKNVLNANSISADEIELENVICDTVSGDKIKIGKGCNIRNVNYITSLEIDEDSEVKESRKTL